MGWFYWAVLLYYVLQNYVSSKIIQELENAAIKDRNRIYLLESIIGNDDPNTMYIKYTYEGPDEHRTNTMPVL